MAFARARFLVYAVILGLALIHFIRQGEGAADAPVPRFSTLTGVTSQGERVGLQGLRGRAVRISLTWTARCSDGSTWGPWRTRFFDAHLRRDGTRFTGAWRHADELPNGAKGTATEQLAGEYAGGPNAAGTFRADARFGRIACTTGAVMWHAER